MTPLHTPDPMPSDAVRGVVRATVDIAAPPERVFRALTDPVELAAWWLGSDSAATTSTPTAAPASPADSTAELARPDDWHVDARPGGEWSMRTVDPNGRLATIRGVYRVVDAPRVLEFTWRASWDGGASSFVRYELAPIEIGGEPGTRLTVTHTGAVMRAQVGAASGAAWRDRLRRLAHHFHAHDEAAWSVGVRSETESLHRPLLRVAWQARHLAVAWAGRTRSVSLHG